MALNIRKYLAELMGVEKISDEDLRKELDELKIDNKLEALTRDGHVPPNPEAQLLARKAITGQATPEELETLLRTPKPAPANTTEYKPPTGPVDADPTEAAIQAHMAEHKVPYHEAASAISKGGNILPAPPGGTA
jgi:hypothetical protein